MVYMSHTQAVVFGARLRTRWQDEQFFRDTAVIVWAQDCLSVYCPTITLLHDMMNNHVLKFSFQNSRANWPRPWAHCTAYNMECSL